MTTSFPKGSGAYLGISLTTFHTQFHPNQTLVQVDGCNLVTLSCTQWNIALSLRGIHTAFSSSQHVLSWEQV